MTTDRMARFRLLRRFTVALTLGSVALAGAFYLQVAGVLGAAAAVINGPDQSSNTGDPTAGAQPTPVTGGQTQPQPPQQQPTPGLGSPVVVTGGS